MVSALSFLISLTILFSIVLSIPCFVLAVENPLTKPNNKFGIHILFDSELEDAAALVNSSGGEWGYVVIPMQSGDRNLEKWQAFMDKSGKLKLIPIIRLATEGDYFNTKVWRKPKEVDILDFANFLNSLYWPTKNRYIIIFNEVNRDDEWGGDADPAEYASLLSYAITVFKSMSDEFFLLNAGLDNASINGNGAVNKATYLQMMNRAVPGIFNQLDGFTSHAYPNPGFSQPPSAQHATSIASFRFERTLIAQLTPKKLPIFITETGWSGASLSDETRAGYYMQAFETVWADSDIVAVTPFLLNATAGPFENFSFVLRDGQQTKQYKSYSSLSKQKGQPSLNPTLTPTPQILGSETSEISIPSLSFPQENNTKGVSVKQAATDMFRWFFKL